MNKIYLVLSLFLTACGSEKATDLFYVEKGQGPVVILLHGADAEIEHTFDNQIDALAAAGYRVLFPHRAGRGQSARYEGKVTTSKDTETIIKFMNDLNIEKAILVGHSAGGAIASDILAKYPSRVSAIVGIDTNSVAKFSLALIESLDLDRYDSEDRDSFERNGEALADMSRAGDYPSDFNLEMMLRMKAAAEKIDSVLFTVREDKNDRYETADFCQVPTLGVVAGRGKIQQLDAETVELQNDKPCVDVKIVTKSGHYIHEERPEAFNEILIDFLNDLSL